MKELTTKEIKNVNGGIWVAFWAGYAAASLATKLYKKYA